jgi:hypothetical protein
MVVNMNMHSDGAGSINEALEATIAHTFSDSQVATADVADTTNRELFVRKSGAIEPALTRLSRTTLARTGSYELSGAMADVAGNAKTATAADFDASLVLTDDHAPVEVLGMKAIDALIADEATPYRDALRTKGIQGLLDMA